MIQIQEASLPSRNRSRSAENTVQIQTTASLRTQKSRLAPKFSAQTPFQHRSFFPQTNRTIAQSSCDEMHPRDHGSPGSTKTLAFLFLVETLKSKAARSKSTTKQASHSTRRGPGTRFCLKCLQTRTRKILQKTLEGRKEQHPENQTKAEYVLSKKEELLKRVYPDQSFEDVGLPESSSAVTVNHQEGHLIPPSERSPGNGAGEGLRG